MAAIKSCQHALAISYTEDTMCLKHDTKYLTKTKHTMFTQHKPGVQSTPSCQTIHVSRKDKALSII